MAKDAIEVKAEMYRDRGRWHLSLSGPPWVLQDIALVGGDFRLEASTYSLDIASPNCTDVLLIQQDKVVRGALEAE